MSIPATQTRTVDTLHILGTSSVPLPVGYNRRDLLLYALGIGCSSAASCTADEKHLHDELCFLHEEHASGFAAFPTYPLVLPYKGISSDVVAFPGPTLHLVPDGLEDIVDPMSILHYDQSLDIMCPLDPNGALLETRSKVVGLYQRRGGVLVRTRSTLSDPKEGRIISVSTQGTFMRGLKISGDAGPALPPRLPRPSIPPHAVSKVAVSREQALLYRLSGDYNPLHADPAAARAAGLKGTILHGLCTLGIAARQVLLHYCPTDPAALKHVSCRFSRTVRPGEPLEVKMWVQLEDQCDVGVNKEGSASSGTTASSKRATVTKHPVVSAGVSNAPGRDSDKAAVTVRFEVCAPEQEGAVVVADGNAVLLLGVQLGGGVAAALPSRARL